MGSSAEVSLAALRSFQELVSDPVKDDSSTDKLTSTVPAQVIDRDGDGSQPSTALTIWKTAWRVCVCLYLLLLYVAALFHLGALMKIFM